MIAIGLINSSGDDIWLEVHGGDEVRPVLQATAPIGPFSSKPQVVQPVGNWPSGTTPHRGYVVFVFRQLKQSSGDSFYRIDVAGDRENETLHITADHRVYTSSPKPLMQTVLAWVVFAVCMAPILAFIAFVMYKSFFKPPVTNAMDWSRAAGDIVFD